MPKDSPGVLGKLLAQATLFSPKVTGGGPREKFWNEE